MSKAFCLMAAGALLTIASGITCTRADQPAPPPNAPAVVAPSSAPPLGTNILPPGANALPPAACASIPGPQALPPGCNMLPPAAAPPAPAGHVPLRDTL